MKKIALFSILVWIMVIHAAAQNVGIGTTSPLEKLSVGLTSQFRIDANGNITRINNIPYSFPSIQGGANQFLRNNGSGTLEWAPATAGSRPVVRSFTVVNSGDFSSWMIDNAGDYNASPFNLDPTLVLYRGLTYEFNINAPGHPFLIAIASLGAAYNVGVTNNNQSVGTITFTVPMDAPNTLYYYCTIHSAMNGQFIIR